MKHVAIAGQQRRKGGRPLSFDRNAALEKAMLAFWRHGYETTSIAELTQAMGITAPSLYTAFGDKRRLFLEAVARYAGDPVTSMQAIEDAPTSHEAARLLLTRAAIAATGETTPPGCLLASAAASGSAASAEVQRVIAGMRRSVAERLHARIEKDIRESLLPTTTDAAALAGLVVTVLQGLSVMARDGMSRSSLLAIAGTTLAAWPQRQIAEAVSTTFDVPPAEQR